MRANIYETDVLIIGGGFAAARAAIAAADAGADVVVVSKAPMGKSGASPMAQGGIAAALHPDDSPAAHFEDVIAGGRGLSDPELARKMAEDAPARVRELAEFGVPFRRAGDRLIPQAQPPGHAYPRIVGTGGGGVGFMNPMRRKVLSYPNIHLYDDTAAIRLIAEGNRVTGTLCLELRSGTLAAFTAGATVLATGGYQEIYPLSCASSEMTGDGFILAFEAGAELVDMEILLFYPTAFVGPPSLKGTELLYESYLRSRVIGARLVNVDGEDLLTDEDYENLAVRDVLSRRIFDEVRRGKGTVNGGVFVDVTRSSLPSEQLREVVSRALLYDRLSSMGIDIAESKFEVAPGSHTVLGGVRINVRGETNIPGLYAAGEVSGNVHGANRLAGNALTDTQVFGFLAGKHAAEFAKQAGRSRVSDEQVAEAARPVMSMLEPKADAKDTAEIKRTIQQTMFQHVGPTRNEGGISKALNEIERVLKEDVPRVHVRAEPAAYNYALVEALETDFMARAAALVCHAARLRRESRGHHYRSDFPAQDESRPPQHTLIYSRNNETVVEFRPVSSRSVS